MSSHTDYADAAGYKGVDLQHPLCQPPRILDAEAGLVERVRSKLAIVGYATSSRDDAPYEDPEWDIVGLNQLYRFIPRADLWCDIHENWDQDNVEGTDHEGWLKACGLPVLMAKTHEPLPTSVRFPLEACIQHGADYFTSTISYLIAWSIHQGYKEVGLWGIDLVVGTEYEVQKACAEFWLGVANGRGMTVHLPPQCALLKHTHRYGYQREPDWGPVSLGEFAKREQSLIAQRDSLLAKLHAIDGALHEVETAEQWAADPAKRAAVLKEHRQETVAHVATIDGAAQESKFWGELFQLRARGALIQTM